MSSNTFLHMMPFPFGREECECLFDDKKTQWRASQSSIEALLPWPEQQLVNLKSCHLG